MQHPPLYPLDRHPNHRDDDDEQPYWRYEQTCGCPQCLDHERLVVDEAWNDWIDYATDQDPWYNPQSEINDGTDV